jgi:glycosyltransferase involved in cell wall biosynthesis
MGLLRRVAPPPRAFRRGARTQSPDAGGDQLRLDYYSPLPPERSGISEYSSLLLPALERRFDVEVAARGRAAVGDVCLYHMGNNPDAHGWILEALRRRPGLVVLHDYVLHHLVAGMTLGRGDAQGYLGAMQREAGVAGRLLAHGVIDGIVPPLWEVRPEDFPLVGEVLEHAAKPGGGLIVHSQYVEQRVREAGYEGRLWRIPHPAWQRPSRPSSTPVSITRGPIIGCFGHLTASKRIPQLVEAFRLLRRLHPDARLLVVGAATPGFALEARLGESDLAGVVREDYVDEDRLWELMSSCDVVVSLRTPTMGETSGSAIRALVMGRPLVVSDVGWFSELPDEVALKIPVESLEIETLFAALELLVSDERAREAMSASAAEYVGSRHDLESVAAAYATAIESVAAGDGARAPVVAELPTRPDGVPLGAA